MRPREHLTKAGLDFAWAAVCALHPRLWELQQRSERKVREMPLGKRLLRTMIGVLVLTALARFVEQERRRLGIDPPAPIAEA